MAEDRLLAGLRNAASALDEAAPSIVAADLPAATRRPDRRPLLALVAAFVLVAGGAAWLLVGRGGDDVSVVTPPGPEVSTSEDRPGEGFAIQGPDGLVTLYDLDGNPLETLTVPDDLGLATPALVLAPLRDRLETAPPDPAEVPEGCSAAAAGGGVRVALCELNHTGRPRRIDVVGSDGVAATLTGHPPDPGAPAVLGAWRWALVSPDGRWVLTQWSGECESRTAFVLATDGSGELRTVTGGDWLGGGDSVALGWAPDGRALIAIPGMGCGGPLPEAGVYLLDPATGERELLRAAVVPDGEPFSREEAFAWTVADPSTPPVERTLRRALDQLGLAVDGWVLGQGVEVSATVGGPDELLQIFGGRTGQMTARLPDERRSVPLLSGEAVVPAANEYALAFTCGANTWIISQYNWESGDVDRKLPFAEALVPHLACTLGPPPG